jgi:hypothetical protein
MSVVNWGAFDLYILIVFDAVMQERAEGRPVLLRIEDVDRDRTVDQRRVRARA